MAPPCRSRQPLRLCSLIVSQGYGNLFSACYWHSTIKGSSTSIPTYPLLFSTECCYVAVMVKRSMSLSAPHYTSILIGSSAAALHISLCIRGIIVCNSAAGHFFLSFFSYVDIALSLSRGYNRYCSAEFQGSSLPFHEWPNGVPILRLTGDMSITSFCFWGPVMLCRQLHCPLHQVE